MTDPATYAFTPVTKSDLPLLNAWLHMPHVRAWWDAVPMTTDDLAGPHVARSIVSHKMRRFAYVQDYDVHGWEGHHFAGLPAGARGIDQYIGAPDLLGQGHGPAFIRARMEALFAAGAPVIATDPHPENKRAISACRKAGFKVDGPPQDSAWGLIVPMLADRPTRI